MKRLLVLLLVWALLVVTGTLVSANGQARVNESNNLISNQNVSNIMEATNVIR